jgi:hypothetical protein
VEVNLHTEIYLDEEYCILGCDYLQTYQCTGESTAPFVYLLDEASRLIRNDDGALINYGVTPQTVVLLMVTGVRTSNVALLIGYRFKPYFTAVQE